MTDLKPDARRAAEKEQSGDDACLKNADVVKKVADDAAVKNAPKMAANKLAPLFVADAFFRRAERFHDQRGFFQEIFNTGRDDFIEIKQISMSQSSANVLRGLHCSQYPKLFTCVSGRVYDVVVDLRQDSPTYLKWSGVWLSGSEPHQVLIPAHCGHGFVALEDSTVVYGQGGTWNPQTEKDVFHGDPLISVHWPTNSNAAHILSAKDAKAPFLCKRHPQLMPRMTELLNNARKNPDTRVAAAAAASMARRHRSPDLATQCELFVRANPEAKRKRVLVIGASGQVGGALMRHMESVGYQTFGTYNQQKCAGMVHFDMGTAASGHWSLKRLLEMCYPDIVCICAGWTWVDGCERDPDRAMLLNCHGPAAVARAAKAVGAKVVYFSSDYVFDGKGTAAGYSEDDTPSPINAYGRSKLEGERAVMRACPDALVIRTAVVYGPEAYTGRNFVYQLCRRWSEHHTGADADRKKSPFRVATDQVSNPTYNADLAVATERLIRLQHSGVFHVAGPDALARSAFAKLLIPLFESRSSAPPKTPTATALDTKTEMESFKLPPRKPSWIGRWEQQVGKNLFNRSSAPTTTDTDTDSLKMPPRKPSWIGRWEEQVGKNLFNRSNAPTTTETETESPKLPPRKPSWIGRWEQQVGNNLFNRSSAPTTTDTDTDSLKMPPRKPSWIGRWEEQVGKNLFNRSSAPTTAEMKTDTESPKSRPRKPSWIGRWEQQVGNNLFNRSNPQDWIENCSTSEMTSKAPRPLNVSLSTAKLQRALASAPLQLRAATDALSHWFSVDETSQSGTVPLLHVDQHSQSGE